MANPQARKIALSALVTLIIGFIVVFLSSSIKNTYQIYFIQMADSFGLSRGQFAMSGAIFMLVFGIASPIVGYFADRIGPKKTIMAGLLLAGVSFILTAFIESFAAFVFLYGVLAAFGLTAMSYVPMGVLVDQSISEKHKGLAYATLTNGAAIGFMLLSPLWIYTQLYFPWQKIYLLLGIIFLLPMMFMVFYALKDVKNNQAEKKADIHPVPSFKERMKEVFSCRPFYVLMLGFFGCGVTMAFIDIHMVAYLQDKKLSSAQLSVTLTVLGAAELIGGFVAGYVADKYPKSYVLTAAYLIRVASLVILLLWESYIAVLAFAALFGLSYLGTVVATSMYALGLFGKESKGFAFGFIWLAHQIGAFGSTQLGASAFDWFGNYELTIAGTAVIALFSALLSGLLLAPNPRPINSTALPLATITK